MAYEAKVIKLKNVRLSFPNLFKAKQQKDKAGNPQGEPKYGASFLIDASTPDGKANYKAIMTEMKRAHEEGYKDKVRLKATCLKAQDDEMIGKHSYVTATEGTQRDEYSGMFIVSASDKKRPTVINKKRAGESPEPVTEEDDVIYSGCYVDASITLWCQDNDYGKRINANLRGVMFRGDGEAFSSGTPVDADSEFDDVDDDDDFENDDGDDFDDDIPF